MASSICTSCKILCEIMNAKLHVCLMKSGKRKKYDSEPFERVFEDQIFDL